MHSGIEAMSEKDLVLWDKQMVSAPASLSFLRYFPSDGCFCLSGRKGFGDNRKQLVALAMFVGVPFPGTGAWTGTIIAYVLGMRPLPAFFAIAAGVALSGVIVTAICMLGLVRFKARRETTLKRHLRSCEDG